MLVAISGSQGCGKSTVMAEIERRGYPVVTRKSSRSILSDWGVTLQQVNDDHELTIKFQDEIIKRKFDDEKKTVDENPGKIVFTERTYMDLLTYATVSLGPNNTHSDWLNNYYNRCLEFNRTYTHIFYILGGKFRPVHDGVRGTNEVYSKLVDSAMLDFTKESTQPERLSIIETVPVDERVSQILTTLDDL